MKLEFLFREGMSAYASITLRVSDWVGSETAPRLVSFYELCFAPGVTVAGIGYSSKADRGEAVMPGCRLPGALGFFIVGKDLKAALGTQGSECPPLGLTASVP
ncbi:MAG: hypothetical protein GY719_25005 [bacterium]|nr:hypothetical protein [bacterium]